MSEAGAAKIKIPPAVVKYIAKDAPREAKLMAARGLVPMEPAVQATAMFLLMQDGDTEVHAAAEKSLLDMPPPILKPLLAEPLHPKLLSFFADKHTSNDELLEPILLNNNTLDETYIAVAATCSEKMGTIIVNNQIRALRTPDIAEEIRKNNSMPRAAIEKLISFLRMNGVVLEGINPELSSEEVKELASLDDNALLSDLFGDEELEFGMSLLEEDEEDLDAEEREEKKKNITLRLAEMTVGQKIKVALKGNKEVRRILIRDTNKVVCTSVVKSPKLQEDEVLAICQMRSVHEDCIRIISRSPEWMRHRAIKVAMVNNPKTPIPISMKMVRLLTVPELINVAKNKNVSSQVQKFAKGILSQKKR